MKVPAASDLGFEFLDRGNDRAPDFLTVVMA